MAEFDNKIEFRSWDTYNLSEDAELDRYALDLEAEKQSELMCKWIELLTQAQAKLGKAKEALQNVEAELLLEVKTNGIPDIAKPTDSVAKAWVQVHPKRVKAQEGKLQADNNVTYMQNARTVLENKKNMIKVESDLWITGYFARPSVPGEVKEELENDRKENHTKALKKSLRRRHLRDK